MPPRKHVFGYKIYHQMKHKLPVAKTELQKIEEAYPGDGPGGPGSSLFLIH